MKKILIIILTVSLVLSGCTVSATDDQVVSTNEVTLVSEASDVNENIEVTEEDTSEEVDISKYRDDYLTFFDDSYIHELNIVIDETDLQDMFDNAIDEEFHKADITLDGISLESIAIRTKGNSTLRDVANSESDRYSFKIKVNEYEDQKLLGLDEFVVNNMYSDASYMREYFSYDLFDTVGIDASETSFINVYFNGELQGLYLLVESVDDSFLKRNFGDNDGNLYRMDQGSNLTIVDGEYVEEADQKNGDDESKSDLYEFMDILNAMEDGEKGDIESILDVDSALQYIAANTLLESYDSYNGQFSQNFYMYNDDGIFTVIPWDYNMSFGTFGSDLLNISIDEPISGPTLEDRPLINNLLAVDEYKQRYYEILEEMIAYFDDFEDKVESIRDMISADVENDPSKFSSFEDFLTSTVYQVDGEVEVNLMANNSGDRGQRPGGQMGDRLPPDQQDTTDQSTDQQGMPPADQQTDQQGMPPADQETDTADQQGMPPAGQQGMPMDPNMTMGENSITSGNGVSIINIIQARIEVIIEQLNN